LAQKPVGLQLNVKVKGKNKALTAAWVDIERDGSFQTTAYTDAKGMFTYLFAYESVFLATFNAHGFFPKTLEIDTRNVPDYEKVNLHDWSIGEIALIKAINGAEASLPNGPVGRIHFDTTEFDFSIDYSFTYKQQQEVKKLAVKVEVLEEEQVAYQKSQKLAYDSLLALGDKYAQRGLNQEAMDLYTLAGFYLPERIEHLEKKQDILVVLRRDSLFDLKLANARKYIESGDYRSAHDALLFADNLKPGKTEVKSLLARTSVGINASEERQNRFNNFMYLGEAAFEGGSYREALKYFTSALELEPEALLAKKKRTESEARLREYEEEMSRMKAMQARRDSAIRYLQKARLWRLKDIDAAYGFAEKALSIHADDSMIIADANEIIEAWHKKETERHNKEQFDILFSKSIDAQNAAEYDIALLSVNEALILFPGNIEAIEQKRDIEQAIKKSGLDKNFKMLCASAQTALDTGNLVEARKYYGGALALKPKESLPRKQIQSIDEQLAALKNKAHADHVFTSKQGSATKTQDLDKNSEDFKRGLALQYPQGVTEERIEEARKITVRRVVVVENSGAEYLKVKHNWGGVYYFKNGTAVPEYIWEKETRNP
jgi:tetratricopeptide (TPR) repeat protein